VGTGRHDGGGGAGMTARLELVWPGKDKFLLVPKDVDGKPVWVERDHPAASEVRLTDVTGSVGEVPNEPFNANLLFTGDSLDVLRVLTEVPEYRSRYRGKVKLVYIDPPFNTGQAFEHYDDWMEHSTWLSFMRERLLLIRELLAPDGSVWVHLDDAEQHRMRLLMDEVFGPANFIANVVWQKAYQPEELRTPPQRRPGLHHDLRTQRGGLAARGPAANCVRWMRIQEPRWRSARPLEGRRPCWRTSHTVSGLYPITTPGAGFGPATRSVLARLI
jgi:hypothetical protein